MARRAAREEGMLIGISSGAALAGVEQKLPELGEQPADPDVQLRHRRALSLGAGLPSRIVLRRPLTSFLRRAVNCAGVNMLRVGAARALRMCCRWRLMRRIAVRQVAGTGTARRLRARRSREALSFDVRDHGTAVTT